MKLSEQQRIFTKDIGLLIQFAYSIGIELTFGDAYRSEEQQQIYVDNGLSRTMNSNHLKRLAVDFNFFINGELTYDKDLLECLGVFWGNLSEKNRWGGYFKNYKDGDSPHFERDI